MTEKYFSDKFYLLYLTLGGATSSAAEELRDFSQRSRISDTLIKVDVIGFSHSMLNSDAAQHFLHGILYRPIARIQHNPTCFRHRVKITIKPWHQFDQEFIIWPGPLLHPFGQSLRP